MDGSEINAEDIRALQTPSPLSIVAIAINGKRESKYIVRWALEKFTPEGYNYVKLIHVQANVIGIPTPMGNMIPISEVREDVVAAYRKDREWQTSELLLPYKNMCALKKVKVDVVVIESNNVENAIAEEVSKHAITNLVIGAPSSGLFTSKQKGLSPKISASVPRFCTVYAISKGKLSSLRPSDLQSVGSVKDDDSDTCSLSSSASYVSILQRGTDRGSAGSYSHFRSPSLPMQRFQALANMNQNLLNTETNETIHSKPKSLNFEEGKDTAAVNSSSSNSDAPSHSSDTRSFVTDTWNSDQVSTSDVVANHSYESQVTINLELEKLRIELRHVKGMYAMAQSETIDASRKISNLNQRRSDEALRLKEITTMEEQAKLLAIQEKEKYEAAKMEADYLRQYVETEASQRREAELKALHDAKKKEKFESVLTGPVLQYQKFRWEDIVSATSSFSDDLKIGMGAYGTVYKSNFHYTTAAVKVLHSKGNRQTKQFLRELEILSKIRHPHLLLLLGACPDHSCLVYEYMENGSLDNRLNQKNNTPPIPWFERFRIAWEVASALVFLHSSKPKPIIHRDLKPANILLDRNLVSKIGDVGLSTMLNLEPSTTSMTYNEMGPVGTMCYIDPEYQRTGMISPKSDVYALGMVILQLLTAKPAVAITHLVETAIQDKNLENVLDSRAGSWPIEEARQLAELGLSCAELRRRDRPDLKDQVVPALERLKEVADKVKTSSPTIQCLPPNHFICPILKDVMNEPCVAADGYTYDRSAIHKWFEENDNSPMTNLALSNKHLTPNYTLMSAIMEWKTRKQ